ncbi:MAG: hypothetical protein IPN79_13390 [Saprospiraceae bacterium]|nr:hypothetical protein [Saprospiraceae bacterium]
MPTDVQQQLKRTLTVNPLPNATIEGITDVCTGESSIFTATGGTSYLWSSLENTDIITVSDNITRTVTVTDVNNCASTAQQTLTIHSFPNAGDIQLANCFSKDSVTMNATGSGTWRFVSGPGSPTIMDINQSNTVVTNFPAAGKYILGWSNGYCESLAEINVGDLCDCPSGINSVSGPANTSVCVVFPSETLSGVLTAPLGGTYQWFYYKDNGTGSIVGTNQDYTTGDLDLGNHKYQRVYRLIANNQTCVYNSNTINIDVHPEPIASITGDNVICRGSSTVLTAQGGAQYLWSSSEPNQSITVNDDIERTVTVTNVFGCSDEVSFSVTLNENPVAVISGPDATCFGSSVTFTASGGDQYLWSNGATTNEITVSDDTQRSVTVTDANGCTSVVSKTLTILPLPDAGNDRVANCFSSSIVTMNAFGSGTWSLLSGPGTPTISDITNPNTTVSGFPSSGTYVLVWNDGFCEDAVSIIVNENCDCPDGDNRINDPNVNVCKIFTSSVLEGNDASPAGGTYSWEYALNSGAFAAAPGINNTEDYITGDLGPGTHSFVRKYSVTIDNKECSYESNIIALRVNNEPVADITGNNLVCTGISTEFIASGGDLYLWNDGSTNPNLLVSVAGDYFVTVTDANACTATAGRTLTVLDNPVVTISGDDRICEGGTATFTASGGNEYVWSSGEKTPEITVTDDSERTVTVTDNNGCSATASKTLIVTEQPLAGPDLLVNCYSRDQVELSASGIGTWITDPSNVGVLNISDINAPNATVSGFSAPGTYNLIWTNGFCDDIMTIVVLDNCDCPNQDNSLNPGQEDTACDTYPSTHCLEMKHHLQADSTVGNTILIIQVMVLLRVHLLKRITLLQFLV